MEEKMDLLVGVIDTKSIEIRRKEKKEGRMKTCKEMIVRRVTKAVSKYMEIKQRWNMCRKSRGQRK